MPKSAIPIIVTFYFMVAIAGIGPLNADAQENECILEASTDVIVEVWNVDKQGNKGSRILKGLIKQGEQRRIKSQHGRIRYARTTNITENEPLSGDIGRPCFSGKIISVP